MQYSRITLVVHQKVIFNISAIFGSTYVTPVIAMKIQMVDLFSQYEKIKKEIDEGIRETIHSSSFINGPTVQQFKTELEKYLHVSEVIPCANGTDALQIALMALGLQPGDEVITSNFTFIASVEAIALLHLKPVLVDVNPETFNLDPTKIRAAITPRTRAIIPVHLFGQPADMEEILQIASEHGLFIIEDNAQAIGSDYYFTNGQVKKSGTIGDIGTTSFFPSKNLGCFGDGGAILTNNPELGEKMRMIVNHGSKVKYYHEEIGVNSRLDSIQAAILLVKLRHLEEFNQARLRAANYYDERFNGIDGLKIPGRTPNGSHVFHQYTLQLKNGKRDWIKEKLAEAGIPSMVYYPVPLSLQKAFSFSKYKPGDFPLTEKLCDEVLSLPMHTELSEKQQNYIAETLITLM